MQVQKYETLKSISEAVKDANNTIFGTWTSLTGYLPLAKKKFENWKQFLPAYFPMCSASTASNESFLSAVNEEKKITFNKLLLKKQ